MAKFAGIILRAADRHRTAQFYKDLGLTTHEHQHGGPKHFEVSPTSEDCVLEIYQSSVNFPQDALMIEVETLESGLEVVSKYGLAHQGIHEGSEVRFVYVADPDKRTILLIEKR